ncbi:MAG: GSCFA domain-containing protein [Melioribacteraceae bacterium]|nr:GSCFA domain-containing protein [Melioribacteraceae bacterium]
MKFRTEIQIEPSKRKIEHNDSIFTIGSCFAENVGEFFQKYKFKSMINPFGVLYNTASIKNAIEFTKNEKVFTIDDLVFHQSEWHSFYHHSDFSHHRSENVLQKVNNRLKEVCSFLENVNWFIISLGTSFVYRYIEKNIIVSNCHKIPQGNFQKEFLSVQENVSYLSELITLIREVNSNVSFVFTVSPVRHWRDGIHENQLSKSSLHLAVNEAVNNFDNVYYFPSYEILIDELRDYRFYAKDMFHPSEETIKYIWEKFNENYFSEDCQTLVGKIDKIIQASNHKIRNPKSDLTRNFAKEHINHIRELEKIYPHINFADELNKFSSLINENE